MSRADLIRQLRDYQVRWENESETAKQFIDFVSSNPDCFERHLLAGHVTGSAWVVNRAGTHVLLTHHRKLNRWVQLGGHADGDADVFQVARREAEEESGLEAIVPVSAQIFDIDVHRILQSREAPAHLHWDVRYALRTTGNEAYTVSGESYDLGWIEIQALHAVTQEESLLRMARKWHAQASSTLE